MKCCRVLVFILLLLFTACAVCSIVFPQFRKTVSNTTSTTDTVHFWYRQSSRSVADVQGVVMSRTYSYRLLCLQGQVYYTVAAALSVAAATFIGASTLFAACWISAYNNDGLFVTSTFMTFMSFTCSSATLGLMVYTYTTTLCPDEETQICAAKRDGYAMAEGFYLLCTTTVGTFICFIIGFGLCCSVLCCGSEIKDDDYA
ncbi:hypothetical protein Q4I30_002459 [Leishmania utingensis]|uniref:Amastin-like protein n=1 Tax=Leishmania utingensis TaxID=653362 RepID=A0AAW3AP24_9TRYP